MKELYGEGLATHTGPESCAGSHKGSGEAFDRAAIDKNPVFTYFIPLIFVGLPFLAMMMSLLSFCHFNHVREKKEFLITVKIRPLSIALFLFSSAILVFYLLPDRLAF